MRDEIRNQGLEPSVILMLTSSSDPRDRERAREIGVVADFMTKPPTADDAIYVAERYGVEAPAA
jgi:CheY-like chemotaxis protein